MSTKAVYPGTFDPVTFGHMDVIKRSSKIFDTVIVAVAIDTRKSPLFNIEERVSMLEKEIKEKKLSNVIVKGFNGLLTDFAFGQDIKIIVRGLRAVSDFEYEFQMSFINKSLHKEIETVFLPATENVHFVSSSYVKEISKLGGDCSKFIPKHVIDMLNAKFS